jgi:hypothetical protein
MELSSGNMGEGGGITSNIICLIAWKIVSAECERALSWSKSVHSVLRSVRHIVYRFQVFLKPSKHKSLSVVYFQTDMTGHFTTWWRNILSWLEEDARNLILVLQCTRSWRISLYTTCCTPDIYTSQHEDCHSTDWNMQVLIIGTCIDKLSLLLCICWYIP